MTSPLKFPDQFEETRRRIVEFQRLSPDERLREIQDTIASGMLLLREAKNRETIDRLYLKREEDWQEMQKELFDRHAQ